MTPKFLYSDDDPWMLAEDIPGSDLFFFQIPLFCFVQQFEKQTGLPYKKILARFEGYHLWFYFGEKDSFDCGENITKQIINDPSYGRRINNGIIAGADKLRTLVASFPLGNLSSLSDADVWRLYDQHYTLHSEYYTYGWVSNAADMFHTNLTKRLKAYLSALGIADDKVNEYLVALTTPTERTPIFEEQAELLSIAELVESDQKSTDLFLNNKADIVLTRLSAELLSNLKKHWEKYHYTKFIFVSGEYTVADYVFQIQEVLKSGVPARQVLSAQIKNLEEAEVRKQKLTNELAIDKKWQDIFGVFGGFMVSKIYRRYAQLFALHGMDKVLKEISKRKFLALSQVKFMLHSEVRELLLNDKCEPEILAARAKSCVYYAEKDFQKVFVGDEAEKLVAQTHRSIDTTITELRGEVGCPGYAKGRVKIIIRAEEMSKMGKGDILVSIATDPDIVPAMKLAGAIVTEQGGVTSHAAIVSRELGIPCVIGTKIATRVLKDGDMVEVDASRGTVKKL